MEGIPDQFRPGYLRDTDIMSRLLNVSPESREKFGKLLEQTP